MYARSKLLEELACRPPVVLPSLLLCDFANLGAEVRACENAGARALHLDIMDGVFVPNITYGMTIVRAVRSVTDLPLDVHLMIADPMAYIERFVDAGANILTVHEEAVDDPRPVLEKIRQCGAVASLALNPPTPLEEIEDAIPHADMALVMSVMPGYGGQEFDERALEKLRTLRELHGNRLLLEVDGGVNEETAGAVGRAGAQMLVTGAAIFRNKQQSYAASLKQLTDLADGS